MKKEAIAEWANYWVYQLGIMEFSRRVGLTRGAINLYQQQKNDSIRHDTIKKIAKFEGVTEDEIRRRFGLELRGSYSGIPQTAVSSSETQKSEDVEEKPKDLRSLYQDLEARLKKLEDVVLGGF